MDYLGTPMRVLVTNDDGFDAPGIRALREAAEQLGEVVVVAPSSQRSECGHSTTTGRTIRVREVDGVHTVDGTPADCVRVALVAMDLGRFDFVLSGVNSGGNLGVDRFMSGTIAAARESVLLGVPSVAVSHYLMREREVDWDGVTRWTRQVLEELFEKPARDGHFWNVNYPHPPSYDEMPEIRYCCPSNLPLAVAFEAVGDGFRYSGKYRDRGAEPGSDVEACFGGSIAVTELSIG